MSAARSILLITSSYPRAAAGSEAAGSFVADLVDALARHVPVRVVAPGRTATDEKPKPNVTVYRYIAPDSALANLRVWHPRDVLRIISILRGGAAAAERAVDDGRVAHALALWALPAGHWARSLLRAGRIDSYAVWMLGSDVWSLGRIPVVRSYLRRVMNDARVRFADGFKLASDAEDICGNAVEFLPSTREIGGAEPGAPRVCAPYSLLYIGRWHPNKGIDLFLEALAALGDEEWKKIRRVDIFGGGPLEDVVRGMVAPLVANGRPVHLGGYIAKEEAEQAIARCDYLVIPSRIESIPVVFSDAMKLHRPVVATPVGDFPNLFAMSVCGVLAQAASASAIADALRQALNADATSFSEGVRRHADTFDLEKIAQTILAKVMA